MAAAEVGGAAAGGGGAAPADASRPKYITKRQLPPVESLTEEYVKSLLGRDDSLKGLHAMLEDEGLRVADIVRRKRRSEKKAEWNWPNAKRLLRFKRTVDKLAIGDDLYEDEELEADKPGSIQAAAKKVPVLPRSDAICTWRGNDRQENLYLCNNTVVVTHGGIPAAFCGYHNPVCVGEHTGEAIPIVAPNEHALCYAHYVGEHGKPPSAFSDPLLIPGVVFAAPANTRHPMAPPKYRTRSKGVTIAAPGEGAGKGGAAGKDGDEEGEGTSSEEDELSAADAEERAKRALRDKAKALMAADKAKEAKDAAAAATLKGRAARLLRAVFKRARDLTKSTAWEAREMNAAATVIQAKVRQLLARRAVDRMRRERLVEARIRAAIVLQRNFRRLLTQRRLKRQMLLEEMSSEKIQRWWRRRVWEGKLARDKELRIAAAVIQRWWRATRARLRMFLLRVRAEARRKAMNKKRPKGILRKLVVLCCFRELVKRQKRLKKRQRRAAIIIQRAWYSLKKRFFKSEELVRRERALRLMRGVLFMQKWMRNYFRRRRMREWRKSVLEAAAVINRYVRMFLARLVVRRRRERVAEVWEWLAPILPREQVAEFLGFPDYDRMFDLKRFVWDGKGRRPGSKPPPPKRATRMRSILDEGAPEDGDADGEDGKLDAAEERELLAGLEEDHADGLDDAQLEELEERDPEAAARVKAERAQKREQDLKLLSEAARQGGRLPGMEAEGTEGATERSTAAAPGYTSSGMAMLSKQAEKKRAAAANKKLLPMARPHGPFAPKLMDGYAPMLKPGRKPMPPPAKSAVASLGEEEREKQARYIDRIEAALRSVDKEDVGLMAVRTFERVVRDGGIHVPPRLLHQLSDAFALPGGDRVDWRAFLEFARNLDRPCPVHHILVCPICIYHGPCDKCACKKYASGSSSGVLLNPHTAVCKCGHLRARHAPAMIEHADPNLPDPILPAHQLALSKSRATNPTLAKLSGIPPDETMGVARCIFAPPPASLTATVLELHRAPELTRPMDIIEASYGLSEDQDHGIGSQAYFLAKRAADVAAGRTSLAAGADDPYRLRLPKGTTVEETKLVRLMPSGALTALAPVPPAAFAQLEGLVDSLEAWQEGRSGGSPGHASRGATRTPADADGGDGHTSPRRRHGGAGSDLLGRVAIPTGAVSGLHLSAIRAASGTMLSLMGMASADTRTLLKSTAAESKARMEEARKAAEAAALPVPVDAPPSSVYLPGVDLSAAVGVAVSPSGGRDGLSGTFRASATSAALPPDAPLLYAEALKAGEAVAAGAAAPSKAGTEALLGGAVAAVRTAQLEAVRTAYRARQPISLSTLRRAQDARRVDAAAAASGELGGGYDAEWGAAVGGTGRATLPPSPGGSPIAGRRSGRDKPVALPSSSLIATGRAVDKHVTGAAAIAARASRRPISSSGSGAGKGGGFSTSDLAERPPDLIPLVQPVDLADRSPARTMFTYLLLLRALSSPGPFGYDLLSDPLRLSSLVTDHMGVLQRHWRELVRDVREGRVQGGPEGVLNDEQRAALAKALTPDPGRAALLSTVLTGLKLGEYRPAPRAQRDLSAEEVRLLLDPGAPLPSTMRRMQRERDEGTATALEHKVLSGEVARLSRITLGNVTKRGRWMGDAAATALTSRAAKSAAASLVATVAAGGASDLVEAASSLLPAHVRDRTPGGTSAARRSSTSPPAMRRSRSKSPAASGAAAAGGGGPDSSVRSPQGASLGSYKLADMLEPALASAGVHPLNAMGGAGEAAEGAVRALHFKARVRDGYESSAHANGRTMAAGAGLPPSFTENLAVIFGVQPAAGILASSELFAHLPPADGDSKTARRKRRAPTDGTHAPSAALQEAAAALLLGHTEAGGEGEGGDLSDASSIAAQLAAAEAEAAAAAASSGGHSSSDPGGPVYDAFNPPLHYTSAPHPFDVINTIGYHFYKMPGPRPLVCRHAGCGSTFGSVGAAIRHLKLAHRSAIAPLHTSLPTDSMLTKTWRDAGLAQDSWLPKLPLSMVGKVAVMKGMMAERKVAGGESSISVSTHVADGLAGPGIKEAPSPRAKGGAAAGGGGGPAAAFMSSGSGLAAARAARGGSAKSSGKEGS